MKNLPEREDGILPALRHPSLHSLLLKGRNFNNTECVCFILTIQLLLVVYLSY
jgi:hypothetical protein